MLQQRPAIVKKNSPIIHMPNFVCKVTIGLGTTGWPGTSFGVKRWMIAASKRRASISIIAEEQNYKARQKALKAA
jgi:hypothetical protein